MKPIWLDQVNRSRPELVTHPKRTVRANGQALSSSVLGLGCHHYENTSGEAAPWRCYSNLAGLESLQCWRKALENMTLPPPHRNLEGWLEPLVCNLFLFQYRWCLNAFQWCIHEVPLLTARVEASVEIYVHEWVRAGQLHCIKQCRNGKKSEKNETKGGPGYLCFPLCLIVWQGNIQEICMLLQRIHSNGRNLGMIKRGTGHCRSNSLPFVVQHLRPWRLSSKEGKMLCDLPVGESHSPYPHKLALCCVF